MRRLQCEMVFGGCRKAEMEAELSGLNKRLRRFTYPAHQRAFVGVLRRWSAGSEV